MKKQLQTAGENIGELNNKICDLEDQMLKLNQRLHEAEDKKVTQVCLIKGIKYVI